MQVLYGRSGLPVTQAASANSNATDCGLCVLCRPVEEAVQCVLCVQYSVCCVCSSVCVVSAVQCVLCVQYSVCCVCSTVCVVCTVQYVLCVLCRPVADAVQRGHPQVCPLPLHPAGVPSVAARLAGGRRGVSLSVYITCLSVSNTTS